MDSTLLQMSHLKKSYGDLVAVADLSLEIRRGEIFGLLGPNGAGKTTAIHCIAGLLTPDSGTVTVTGCGSPLAPGTRLKLGIAPQALSLYERLTAAENLTFFGRLYRLRGSELDDRVEQALKFVGLENRRHDELRTYSGGMKRRVNLAAAILHQPELILLDEPTVGVDPQSRNSIFDNILALKDEGRTIVYTTHYMEEAERLCDRVAVMDHGRLLALDTVAGLLEAHGGLPTLVIDQDGAEVRVATSEPLKVLSEAAAKAPIRRFTLEQPALEQVFLSLTGRNLRD